jgi:drug/metabolite transporter (DMT)-like permease
MYQHQNKGIGAGIGAGVFWGTPFLVPMVLTSFTSFEITFGRFLFFGIISLFYLPRIIQLMRQLNAKELLQIFILSATGYWLYTLLLFAGVKLSNGVISALIIGCMPITITMFSKPIYNLCLICGLVLISIGIFCLLAIPLLDNGLGGSISLRGVLLLFIALAMWTWFGLYNSRFMHCHQYIKSLDYSSMMGFVSLVCMLPIFGIVNGFSSLLHHPQLLSYIFWCVILGVGASWLANVFWAYSAKNCPGSIIGALIVSETIFGLIYSFIYAWRLPYMHELIAIICLMLGVTLVLKSQLGQKAHIIVAGD